MARYLLVRIAEEFGVRVTFAPKLFPHLKGSCCHTTYSTKFTRKEDGIKAIEKAIDKLSKKHDEHTKIFYPSFKSMDREFFGVEDRQFLVRIPKYVTEKKKGYFQDRRPRANIDPYRVIHLFASTVLKGGS